MRWVLTPILALLLSSVVVAALGGQAAGLSLQAYPGDVRYHDYTYLVYERALLANELNRTVKEYVYIAIPRNDTRVFCRLLEVEPGLVRLERDSEGNVFALVSVELPPGGSVWINLTYRVRVRGYVMRLNKSKALWPPLRIAQVYTSDTLYWDTENATLRRLAYGVAYSDNPLESAFMIGKWIQSHLIYEVTHGRKGSNRALISVRGRLLVKGDCVEVADVFVTMARILGIPARTVYGFLLTEHEEKQWLNFTVKEEGAELLEHWGGHMWIQIYVPPWGWIDVELLEDLRRPKIGELSNLHIPFGVEGATFHGTGLLELVIPSYLTLKYQEFTFKRG